MLFGDLTVTNICFTGSATQPTVLFGDLTVTNICFTGSATQPTVLFGDLTVTNICFTGSATQPSNTAFATIKSLIDTSNYSIQYSYSLILVQVKGILHCIVPKITVMRYRFNVVENRSIRSF